MFQISEVWEVPHSMSLNLIWKLNMLLVSSKMSFILTSGCSLGGAVYVGLFSF